MDEEEKDSEPEQTSTAFGWRFWLVLTAVITILAALSLPRTIRAHKNPNQTEATSNLRQIGIALFEFETKYGSYPNADTVQLVSANQPKHGHNLSGKSSNTLFRQLIAVEIIQSERMFYADVDDVRKPDDEISPGKALQKGEVAFAYIAGLSTTGNPARPVAFAPVIPGTTKFDPKPFEGKAVFLRIDNSVTSMKIQEDGRVYSGGIDILSPEHPIWDGQAVDIRYPDL